MKKFIESQHFLARLWKKLRLPTHIQLRIMRLVQDQFLVGVTGVIFNEQKQILLLKHTYRQTVWSLPGGYVHKGEHPYDTLEREVKEESGFTVVCADNLKTQADRESARLDMCIVGTFKGGTFMPSAEVSHYGFFDLTSLPKISREQKRIIKEALRSYESERTFAPSSQRAFI